MNLQRRRYLLMTLDPVHIGTGGYRLGRVDNAIVREPGTNLPKIPGTSLSGAVRSAAAMRLPNKRGCAGQGRHCGKFETCPICYTFGSVSGDTSRAGAVSLSDARLVLFPVASWEGPVWMTTAETLKDLKFPEPPDPPADEQKVLLSNGLRAVNDGFGLGWLMLEVPSGQASVTITAPTSWQSIELSHALARTVIVHESIFAHLVNSSLEVRTSVAIEPDTGAAKDGALFTYEAIPRATFLSFDLTIDDYRPRFPEQNRTVDWKKVGDVVEDGLGLAEYLGIGGMGTRGFGRIKRLAKPVEQPPSDHLAKSPAETSPAEGGNGDDHSG